MPTNVSTVELFDIDHYPLHRPGSSEYTAVVERARYGLATNNCAQLENFLRPQLLAEILREGLVLAPAATYTRKDLNPYLEEPPQDTPASHPQSRFSTRVHGMVRADQFTNDSMIRAVFDNTDLCRFIADCLELEELYPYRDPFGCININVQPSGSEFAWHFDHNDFTVSLGLQQPEEGGFFEYAPNIRDVENENYNAVQSVLEGDRSRVRSLVLRPGDLQLFRGSNTLHRVTAPTSEQRLSLLLSYVEDPDHIATPEYAHRIWGETHPLHVARRGP